MRPSIVRLPTIVVMLWTLWACGSSDGEEARGAKCSVSSGQCVCTAGASNGVSCSASSLGATALCCSLPAACQCDLVGCFESGGACLCNYEGAAKLAYPKATPIDSCQASSSGVCCRKKSTHQCFCSPVTSCKADEESVTSCSAPDLACPEDRVRVSDCSKAF